MSLYVRELTHMQKMPTKLNYVNGIICGLAAAMLMIAPSKAWATNVPNPAVSATPSPQIFSDASVLTKDIVEKICLPANYGLHLDAWVFDHGYLMCSESNAADTLKPVFKLNAAGQFVLVLPGFGLLDAPALVQLGKIPTDIANRLDQGINSQLMNNFRGDI